jgi:DNA polymerase-3 subunit delta'
MSFNDIVGQERPIGILSRAVERERTAQAYLFLGMEGVGKKLAAYSLAKALNCRGERSKPYLSCDSCLSCLKIDHGNHPDVQVVGGTPELIKIGQVRELQRKLHYKPLEGRKKVVIIDGAENLGPAAANALLKTLEEPPPETVIILISTSLSLLLPTIISRCQKIRFQPLSINSLREVVGRALPLKEEAVQSLAFLSGGSPGRALQLAEESIWDTRKELLQRIEQLSSDNIEELFQFSGSLAEDKEGLEGIFELLKTFFRDILIFRENGKDRVVNLDLLPSIERLASKLSSAELVDRIEAINEAQSALRQNVNRQLAVERMLLRICNWRSGQEK